MVKRIVRWVLAVSAAALVALPIVSCGESSSPSGTSAPAAGQVNYKCSGCGKTAEAAPSAAAPSC